MRDEGSPDTGGKQRVMASLGASGKDGRALAHEGKSPASAHALRAAEENERALEHRLHRVHDPKGIELLRGLRERIAAMKRQLNREDQP